MPDQSPDLFYRRLQIGPGASQEEIVRAYRRLAQGVHPDTHPDDPGAAQRFREITEAYQVLADPSRRARYDQVQSDATIRVVAGPTATGGGVGWGRGRISGEERPFVLGVTSRAGDPPLWASPVRVERHGEDLAPESFVPSHPAEGGLLHVLSEMLDSLWRR